MSGFTVQREDDFDFLSSEYDDLYALSDATPFQHGIWLDRLYNVLAPAREAEKVIVTARRDGGELVLVLPFVRRRLGPIRLVEYADLGVADYAAPVSDGTAGLEADPSMARRIREALGRFDLLRIERVADSPDPLTVLLAGATSARHLYDTHLMTLASSVEEWRGALDAGFVRHLDRKHKRLRPKGEKRLLEITDVTAVEDLMRRMQEFRAARFAERRGIDLVQDPDCFEFYCAVVRDSVKTGAPGTLSVLEVGGEPVAIAFDLIAPDRDLFLLVGYDMQRLRNYSLGLLIVEELAKDAIGRGQQFFDLTVGDESYKADFGARRRPVYEVRVIATLRGRTYVLGRTAYLRTRRLAKKTLEAWARRRAALAAKKNSSPAT
ncbi:GNAT family N-acetyltransferase [Arthrobacter sulfonylureivorans]|uniref:GNAT family N-acetyltransferase n=1 Tax=Arthrobacter sulfonylureivorans TaxID=2486855 RepID=A0ABY3W4V3_9MICC|nr:GNAT family N-acetyltransferase [Arthrobacter sulfonylureivorans]UNK44961.1 GNAT family N-acetyltransferase [Arthrobacter sulfonylureivorans]